MKNNNSRQVYIHDNVTNKGKLLLTKILIAIDTIILISSFTFACMNTDYYQTSLSLKICTVAILTLVFLLILIAIIRFNK